MNLFWYPFRTATLSSDLEFHKPTCVSCAISEKCEWVSGSFSEPGEYFMLSCLGPGVPTYTLRSTNSDSGIFMLSLYSIQILFVI